MTKLYDNEHTTLKGNLTYESGRIRRGTFDTPPEDVKEALKMLPTFEETDHSVTVGDSGPKVERIQRFMKKVLGKDLGTFGPNGDGIDGEMGWATNAAAQETLKTLGLPVPEQVVFNTELLEQMKVAYAARSTSLTAGQVRETDITTFDLGELPTVALNNPNHTDPERGR